jgi:hypothetical protein
MADFPNDTFISLIEHSDTREELADGLLKDETLRKDKQLNPDKLAGYL